MAASAAPRCNNAGLNNGGAQIRPAEVLDGSYGFGGDVEMSDSVYTKPAANGVLKADAPSFRPAPRGRGFGGFYRGRGDRRGGRSFV